MVDDFNGEGFEFSVQRVFLGAVQHVFVFVFGGRKEILNGY